MPAQQVFKFTIATSRNGPFVSFYCFRFDLGRARGTTCLWTEDWFGDGSASQWSYYGARLRGAAALAPTGDVEYGGYVVGRMSTGTAGLVQKVMALVGGGAKALRVYTFGPEFMFPGNSYSEHPDVFPRLTEALDLIGAAEFALLPGRRPPARIAIVYPRSSFLWDEWGVPHPTSVVDETNNDMAGKTMDYAAEVYGLYVPVQWRSHGSHVWVVLLHRCVSRCHSRTTRSHASVLAGTRCCSSTTTRWTSWTRTC